MLPPFLRAADHPPSESAASVPKERAEEGEAGGEPHSSMDTEPSLGAWTPQAVSAASPPGSAGEQSAGRDTAASQLIFLVLFTLLVVDVEWLVPCLCRRSTGHGARGDFSESCGRGARWGDSSAGECPPVGLRGGGPPSLR